MKIVEKKRKRYNKTNAICKYTNWLVERWFNRMTPGQRKQFGETSEETLKKLEDQILKTIEEIRVAKLN